MEKVNYMSFGESQIPGLRICMAMFATCALMLGLVMSLEGHTSLALSNLCGASFFVFAYHNPEALLANQFPDVKAGQQNEVQNGLESVVQKKFLWTSLMVGLVAVLIEFKEYLPLG